MAEAIRLVVWDLDETFWAGTLTEGGITFRPEVLEIVQTLAERGIVSTICSKNDLTAVQAVLEEHDAWDWFVMPSIDWSPKGPRVARLVDDFQLRAASVLFIDDNAHNRAEVGASVAGIQLADQHLIDRMLGDRRLIGNPDPTLNRVARYKLLETKRDDLKASGGEANAEFLRACDIRVRFDHDVAANLDRAIELINRTNQLNFTRHRLPEDIEEARAMLTAEISRHDVQAMLVEVADRYGDYGLVGFVMTSTLRSRPTGGTANMRLLHFCFSCRTLGMKVEKWVYDRLGHPWLEEDFPDLLTDLRQPEAIDWIREVEAIDGEATVPPIAPHIFFAGGCEAQAVGVYLRNRCDSLDIHGGFAIDGRYVRVNHATALVAMLELEPHEVAYDCARIGLPVETVARDFYRDAPDGSLFVFNLSLEADDRRARHRDFADWTKVVELEATPGTILEAQPLAELHRIILSSAGLDAAEQGRNLAIAYASHALFAFEHTPETVSLTAIFELIERAPRGARLILVLDHAEVRDSAGALSEHQGVVRMVHRLRSLVGHYPFVTLASFSEVIEHSGEVQIGGNHYDRVVFWRFAELLAERATALPARETEPVARRAPRPGFYKLTGETDSHLHLGFGWAEQEAEGRWMMGDVSELTVDLGAFAATDMPLAIEFWCTAITPAPDGRGGNQGLIVAAGQQRLLSTAVAGATFFRVPILDRAQVQDGRIRLHLIHTDAMTPLEQGRGEDSRRLSIQVQTVCVRAYAP